MLLKITSKSKTFHYVNPAHIASVTIDADVALNMAEGRAIWITAAEWQRIAPLITNPEYKTIHEASFREYARAWHEKQCAAYDTATRALANEAFEALVKYVTGAHVPVQQAPSLPADVVEAQRHMRAVLDKPWNTDTLFDAAHKLMSAVGEHIPAEGDAS